MLPEEIENLIPGFEAAAMEKLQQAEREYEKKRPPKEYLSGEGRVRSEREIEVEVPAGVTSENFLTLRGQGSVGPRSGPRGDIIILLEVKEDERFLRDGSNLLHELPITFTQAALGDEVAVPTIEGTAKV